MDKSYVLILNTFLANKLLMLCDNSHPYNSLIKLDWWKDDNFCNYHRSKGHNKDNCFKLKDAMQDLIDGGKVLIDGLVKISNHKVFKTPLPEYEKGESSQVNKKNLDAKINYTYANNDNVINTMKPIENVFMMRPRENEDSNHDAPKLIL